MKKTALLGIILFLLINSFPFLLAQESAKIPTEENLKIPMDHYSDDFGSSFKTFLLNKYFYEIIGFLVFIIYILNYYRGKKVNVQILTKWLVNSKSVFEQNFAHIGVSSLKGGNQGGALFDEESCYTFKFYASGRVNCDYCLVTFDLKKRQDLITLLIFNSIWIEKDRVIIDIPLNLNNYPPIVFAVVKKRDAKTTHSNNPDLKYFCRKLTHESLHESMVILGENEETKNYLLDTGVVNTLNKFQKVFQMIFITDQKSIINSPLTLRFVYTLNSYDLIEMGEYSTLIKLVFYLVDQLAAFKMSSINTQKAEKERQVVQEIRLKEEKERRKEELDKQKLEKKKLEDAKLNSLPPEKKRKLEEKEHKQSLKKKFPRKILKY